jgi:hypothetical protein
VPCAAIGERGWMGKGKYRLSVPNCRCLLSVTEKYYTITDKFKRVYAFFVFSFLTHIGGEI